MPRSQRLTLVYIETGNKRTVAAAVDWPGWSRGGRDEQSALQALFDYAPRYARVLRATGLDFRPPESASDLTVVERVKGNATTDMDLPAIGSWQDTQPVDIAVLERLEIILKACWRAFDAAARQAEGKELRKGPRGGGRDLDRMVKHVIGGDESYLSALGWKVQANGEEDVRKQLVQVRKAVMAGLVASANGEIAPFGPRGGKRWSPRYFVRRVAYHVLDHAWEIEDRILLG